MRPHFSLLLAVLAIAPTSAFHGHQYPARSYNSSSVASSQPTNSSGRFIGYPSCLKPIAPKAKFFPDILQVHQDAGNTGTTDNPGPRGRNISLSTMTFRPAPLLFDERGRLTAGVTTSSGDSICAIDPETFDVLSSWEAPAGVSLKLAYMVETVGGSINSIVVTSAQGRLFVVGKNNSVSPPTFTTLRDINLTNVLQPGEVLLNAEYDGLSNLWFTTGLIYGTPGTASAPQNTTTIGYISPSQQIHTVHFQHQAIENSISVSNSTVYVVTGPPINDTQNATGYMYSFTASDAGVETLWSAPYNAGSRLKPGGFARGSGTTPVLLRDSYVAITDNSDTLFSVLIYHQAKQSSDQSQLLCKVPIFRPGAGACDIAPVGHAGDQGYSLFFLNDYGTPATYPGPDAPSSDINGPFNNLTQMTPGGVKVHIPLNGSDCKVVWEHDIRMTTFPILSTETALLYGYEQNLQDANAGEWVWYLTARDWETGDLVWKVETGAGGNFNNDYQGTAIGKDGTLYQGVVGGTVALKDGGGTVLN